MKELTPKKTLTLKVREATLDDLQKIFFSWKTGGEDVDVDSPPVANALEIRYRDIFKEKFNQVDSTYKIWVAQKDGELVAWQYLMPFENNPVSRFFSAEISTYVSPQHQNKGIGTALVRYALQHARKTLLQYVVGFVSKNNKAMISVAENLGFEPIGSFPPAKKSPETAEILLLVYRVPPGEE